MNAQYSLPTELPDLGRADRTLEGVRKCILHAVWNAQGKGCAPGAVGVCVGGDRTSGYVAREGAAVPHARRRERRSAAGGARGVDHGRGQQARHRHHGIRRADVARSGARSARSIGCPRASSCRSPTTAGRSAGWASCSTAAQARSRSGSIAIRPRPLRRWPIRPGSSARAARSCCAAPLTEEQVRALKVGDVVLDLGPRVHGTRCRPRAPDEARAAGRSATARCSITAVRSWRRTATAGA